MWHVIVTEMEKNLEIYLKRIRSTIAEEKYVIFFQKLQYNSFFQLRWELFLWQAKKQNIYKAAV